MGQQPVRPAPVRHLLQDLHREGLGDALRGDLGGLGGAADPGAVPVDRVETRAPPGKHAGAGDGQDPHRHLPLSAKGTRHDVGERRTEDRSARRAHRHGPGSRAPGPPERQVGGDRTRRRRRADVLRRGRGGVFRRSPRPDRLHRSAPARGGPGGGAGVALPRLPHRRAHRGRPAGFRRPVALHPRPGRAGRPHPELQGMVARHGPGQRQALPRDGVLLLRGGRGCGRAAMRPSSRRRGGSWSSLAWPGAARSGTDSSYGRRRHIRSTTKATRSAWRSFVDMSRPSARACIRSDATACTSTTTRTTR